MIKTEIIAKQKTLLGGTRVIQYLCFNYVGDEVKEEPDGKVDDRAEEEEGEANPDSAKGDAPHVPKDQAVDTHECNLV